MDYPKQIIIDDVFRSKRITMKEREEPCTAEAVEGIRFVYSSPEAGYDINSGGMMYKQLYDIAKYKSLGNELIDKIYYSFLHDCWVRALKPKKKVVELDVIQCRILDELQALNELIKYTDLGNLSKMGKLKPLLTYTCNCYPEFANSYKSLINNYYDKYSLQRSVPVNEWAYNKLFISYNKLSKTEYAERLLPHINAIYDNLCSEADENNRDAVLDLQEGLMKLVVDSGIIDMNGQPVFFYESEIRDRMRLEGQKLSKWALF